MQSIAITDARVGGVTTGGACMPVKFVPGVGRGAENDMISVVSVLKQRLTTWKFNPYHDKEGKFTTATGDADGVVSPDALQTPENAVKALHEGRIASISKEDVRGFLDAAADSGLTLDLTDVHVNGTTMFGGEGLGIPRDEMPQIPKEHRDALIDHLRTQGISVEQEDVDPLSLAPAQKEISAGQVGKMLRKFTENPEGFLSPILVSQSSRVLDGHHNWGMMTAVALSGTPTTMPIFRIGLDTQQALKTLHEYADAHGFQRKVMKASQVLKANPYHDARGRFATKTSAVDILGWRQVGPQGGSNPGGVFLDPQGERHYVKFPQQNPEQANAEKLADDIYRTLGIPVKHSQLVKSGRSLGLAGKMLQDAQELGHAKVNASADVKAGYVADAYLANWDVFGMTYDNILTSEGREYRVDNGGTLFFRAQGATKDFPADRVDELTSLIAPGRKGSKAYRGLTADDYRKQAQTLVTTLTNDRLASLVHGAGLSGSRARQYLDALKGRRDVISRLFKITQSS